MNIRSGVAQALASLCSFSLKNIFHRRASQLPGRIALAVSPSILSDLKHKVSGDVFVVCGTNGKTTTTNLIAELFEQKHKEVVCNRFGANMLPGVVSAFLEKKRADVAVLEVDELSVPRVLSALKPQYFILLNLFRDQLDRAGEIDQVQNTILEGLLKSLDTTLVFCGDDPLSFSIAKKFEQAGGNILSFGICEDMDLTQDRVSEARFCQNCSTALQYEYKHYAQLGAFKCPQCDFARPHLRFYAQDIIFSAGSMAFTVRDSQTNVSLCVSLTQTSPYLIYNSLALVSVCILSGLDLSMVQTVLNDFKPQNGRLQRFSIDGHDVLLNLAKNPAGFNQNLLSLIQEKQPYCAFFAINDNPQDGCDISWIWDIDFERLSINAPECIYASGIRKEEVVLRLKYAGFRAECVDSIDEVFSSACLTDTMPLYALTNYSALWSVKARLESLAQER